MKNYTRSYQLHNAGYEKDLDYYTKDAVISRTEITKDFERNGFKFALDITKNLPYIHVDIGCGVGWLIRKMQPYFKKSIGIEPSGIAINHAKKVIENLDNVTFLEEDMLTAFKKIPTEQKIFFTTGAVLSHIESSYVEEFLSEMNNVAEGSVLYFSEPYDKNIDWDMWHIRNKRWWRKNLKSWQLIFLDLDNSGYFSGIYGIKLKDVDLLKNKDDTLIMYIVWSLDKYLNIIKRISSKILRILLK